MTDIFAPGLLRDQVAVITGGGSGIGLATAKQMIALGAKVAICGRDQRKLDAGLAELPGAFARTCDIREIDQVAEFIRATHEHFGKIDILVNNAGGQFPSPAQHISANGFLAVVKNNLAGTFNMTREVANQAMIPAKRGRIVNVIANIYRGFPGMVHTGAARAGVENMTMTLAVEWAQFGICVNAVAPGIILSSGTQQYPQQLLEMGISRIPMKRAGTVDECAHAIIFLASPAAAYATGTTLRLDGGQALAGETWSV